MTTILRMIEAATVIGRRLCHGFGQDNIICPWIYMSQHGTALEFSSRFPGTGSEGEIHPLVLKAVLYGLHKA